MYIPFAIRTKKFRPASTCRPVTKIPDTENRMQELKAEDFMAVSGGPEVENEPD
jgi:hypothetical protein